MGTAHILGTLQSSLETFPPPPDGSLFAIVDGATTVGGGGWPSGSLAYIQNEIRAELSYRGTLTGVDLVEPLFGTDGLPLIPEPGTGSLLAFGLLGLAASRRRLR